MLCLEMFSIGKNNGVDEWEQPRFMGTIIKYMVTLDNSEVLNAQKILGTLDNYL